MTNRIYIFISLLLIPLRGYANEDSTKNVTDQLRFRGELSSWIQYNEKTPLNVGIGARFIPQLNYEIRFKSENNKMLDFEGSVNGAGDFRFNLDSSAWRENITAYRLWGRYSSDQLEVRVGLQKIDFGTANMLRPLMWFDSVDPKDPLQYTQGVYGILARYYFLNNANIWLWGLYGNDKKGYEFASSSSYIPEFGGRVQLPLSVGEVGFSYHHRNSDLTSINPAYNYKAPENRGGFDIRLDVTIGLWVEASYIHTKDKNIGMFQNQELINLGLDYTFGIGNGIYVAFEHLLASFDEDPFAFQNRTNTSALNITYPVGLFDNLSSIIYYNYELNGVSTYFSWMHDFNRLSLYGIGYWNSDNFTQSLNSQSIYSGVGFQIMLVYKF